MKRISKRFLAALLCLVLAAGLVLPVSAAEEYVPDSNVAVFATDRHDNETIIGEVLGSIRADGYSPCLVALGGDLVGDGPDIDVNENYAPVVDTSVVQGEVHAALSAEVKVAILMASHDRNMTDSSGVLVSAPGGFSCGEYYVYIIPEAYMSDETAAAASAEQFILWAESEDVDASKPLVVLSHMPIHYLRKDNLGGAIWHEALNRVATAGGEEAVRNVIFFHGHNHTADSEEYYHPVGTSLAIQGLGEDGQSEGVLQYTYITAGYLNKNGTATLLRVEETQIVVDKYTAEGGTNLGVIERLPAAEPEEEPVPEVTEEPAAEETPAMEETPEVTEQPEADAQPEAPVQNEEPAGEEGGGVPWGIIAAVLVVLVIIVVVVMAKKRKK